MFSIRDNIHLYKYINFLDSDDSNIGIYLAHDTHTEKFITTNLVVIAYIL